MATRWWVSLTVVSRPTMSAQPRRRASSRAKAASLPELQERKALGGGCGIVAGGVGEEGDLVGEHLEEAAAHGDGLLTRLAGGLVADRARAQGAEGGGVVGQGAQLAAGGGHIHPAHGGVEHLALG